MNFDTEGDRPERARIAAASPHTFTIGGHEFRLRAAVHPDVLARYWANLIGEEKLPELDYVPMLDDTVIAMIVPEDEAEWRRVRTVGALEQPIDLVDIHNVIGYAIRTVAGRPFSPPSDSGSSSESPNGGTPSKEASSSREAPASTD